MAESALNDDRETKTSTYMRPLPARPTALASPAGKTSLLRALAARTAEGFYALCGTFASQSDTTLCGPGSLAVVLNALGVDPGVGRPPWKGSIWRWFSDDALACSAPGLSAAEIKTGGVTLIGLGRLAACHGLSVRVCYATASGGLASPPANADRLAVAGATLGDFRRDLAAAVATGESHVIVSFSREALGQTGDGHFSPVAAVDSAADTALVLDVARFKYPAYWARLEELYAAMARVDAATGLPRGYLVLSRGSGEPSCDFCASS